MNLHALNVLHDHDIDIVHNEIYLMGHEKHALDDDGEPGVEYIMANRFLRNLNTMRHKGNTPTDITVHMKTCGGWETEGLAIYDAIKAYPAHVTIISYTHARSMSSIIPLAADYFIMMPHSTYMFHDGTIETGGTIKQVLTEMDEAKRFTEIMYDLYTDHLKDNKKGSMHKWSKPRIKKWLIDQKDKKEEVYFTAEEAVRLGFANEVMS